VDKTEEIARSLPDRVIREEYTRRFAAHRPRVMAPCPKCGREFSAREMRAHVPKCARIDTKAT